MSRATEGLRRGSRVSECADSGGTILSRHTCGAAFELIHRDGERRSEHRGVVGHLMNQIQLGAALLSQRATQHTATVVQHEVHLFGSDSFCCGNKIPFVLTILIIHYDDELTLTYIFDCLFYSIQHNIYNLIICYLSFVIYHLSFIRW